MAIKCCTNCLPPKRSSGCHSTCPDYTREKAQHEEERKRYRAAFEANCDANAYQANTSIKNKKRRRIRF